MRRRLLSYAAICMIFAGAFVFRLWPISKVHFWDEAVYLQNAEVICCGKANYTELDSRPPMMSLIFAAVFLLWHHIYAADIVAAFINALGPVFLYLSGRMVVGRMAAGVAALLLAFEPFFTGAFPGWFESDNTGNSLLSDSPALTILILSFWLLLVALRHQSRWRFAVVGFAFAIACLMRFACLSNVVVLGLLVLVADQRWKQVLACAAGFMIGFGPYLCWSRLAYGGFFETVHRGWVYYQGPRQSLLFYTQSFGVMFGWITAVGLMLWVGRWMASHYLRGINAIIPDQPWDGLPRWLPHYLWVWAGLEIAIFFALPHQEPRYAMPIAPPLFLLAGAGLVSVIPAKARFAGIVAVSTALLFTFLPNRRRFELPFVDHSVTEEMQIAEYLDQNLPHDTVVYSNFNYPLFGYYAHLNVYELPERGQKLYMALTKLPYDGVLVAYTDPEIIPDPKPEWLAAQPQFEILKKFPTATLYWYRRAWRSEADSVH